ncbi:MAG: hypothetical protein UT02_C0057G0006 [Parcubacteria group bacterium GW2011_GWC2_38_7]|nr:MAG: hypothetical protein UT02_C0057G0006 [Parcubacteria group bacterium GW2011_GWC2_38_7]
MLNISEYMNQEHEELDELLFCFLETIEKEESAQKGEELLSDFKERFFLHMKLEDEYLFPRLSASLGLTKDSSIAELARVDHLKLLKLFDLSQEAFLNQEKSKILLAGNNLARALQAHHAREDEIQYPVSDKFISQEEWDEILKKFN